VDHKLKDCCEVQIAVTRFVVTQDTGCRRQAIRKFVANCCKFPYCCGAV